MGKDDYEIDYDDDGNEVRIKVTKAMLRDRLAHANVQRQELYDSLRRSQDQARSAQRRIDNIYWGQRVAAALDDGQIYATSANIDVQSSYMDMTFDSGLAGAVLPGQVSASLNVTFVGDPNALKRLGEFLLSQS